MTRQDSRKNTRRIFMVAPELGMGRGFREVSGADLESKLVVVRSHHATRFFGHVV